MRLAEEFRARHGRGYFDALLELERGGPRHVGTTGAVEWLAAWAPGHQKELWGVLPGRTSLAELGDDDAEAFARGVARIVSFYEEGGTHPFTLAFHSSPQPGADGWALHLKVCSRPAFRPGYVNYDTWFTPKFLGDEVHTEAPEAYAARLRARW
jgi:galactose-1-phosphate uridylyltransferase